MGRLDEAAKQKVVELRKAGLSFRKIKAELELENIREFQGRPPGRARPSEIGGTPALQLYARGKGAPEKWSGINLQNLIRLSSQQSQRSDIITKSPNTGGSNQPGSSEECNSRSSSTTSSQGQGHREENDIQIVSVTSLSQTNQTNIAQSPATRTPTSVACSAGAITAALTRRRVSPSPTTNSMLAARKRILDKALSHRIKQMASLLRRDQTGVHGAGLRNPVQQPSSTYNSNDRVVTENQSELLGTTSALRYSVQKPNVSVRSPQPPPRVGIRLPSQSVTGSVPGILNLRLPAPPGSQSSNHNEGHSSTQQTSQDSGGQAILHDKIQTLSSEVHNLGVAVKMLVEQQCRLEREQTQQTNIQKQILSTLQTMSSKMGCCSSNVQQQQKTHSQAPAKSTSFNQDTYTCSEVTYVQCSQSQPSFNSIDALETVEPFKLPELSPTSMNGFAACSSAESLPLIPSPLYQQQNTLTQISGFTQNYVSPYNQSNNQAFGGNKLVNFQIAVQ
ncbi:hypothetical protein WMY93_003145 [Mugilogobius chulae]|uniref:Uncharacterized protein n=1 Tax=Mugilogobius chulae TaxID=88201 RepID=A0AAW0PYI6_9GOBI